LRFAGIGGFVTDPGVTLIAGAAAIGCRSATAEAACAGFAHSAEQTVVTRRTVEYRLGLARVGCFVADAGVALIAGAAAVGRRTAAAHAGRAGFAYRAKLTIVAGRTVNHGLRLARVRGLVAYAGVALVAGAAAIGRRTAAADAGRTGLTRVAELAVVTCRTIQHWLGFASIGCFVADTGVALIACAAAISG